MSPTGRIPRRTLLAGAAGISGAAALGAPPLAPRGAAARESAAATYRAAYHFTVPDQWMNDPQRPLLIDGTYHYYYLYNPDYTAGAVGTGWRLATSDDLVTFRDRGMVIPKDGVNADVWSGSAVVDVDDTAGFGAGAVIVLATQAPGEGPHDQAQFLWYSTDGGLTFRPHGTAPVLANPGVVDFRDPKVIRDPERGRWVMALAENDKIGLYLSENLREWRYVSGFVRGGIGVLECPDLFRIEAADGTARWVIAASANGKAAGLPNTYAYWLGEFDGETFHAETAEPRWLDHGFDWYAAVTWERYADRAAGVVDPTVRYAIGWANNWDYANTTPTLEADGFNGTDSVVREVRLVRDPTGALVLASRPVAALDQHVTRTVEFGDVAVNGTLALPYQGVAYELSTTLRWDAARTVGLQLRASADGTRHVDVGRHEEYAFVNRGYAPNPDASGRWQESRTPFPAARGELRLRALVDRTTVEVFFDDGSHTHSHVVFPPPEDTAVNLFALEGGATFTDLVIREFGQARTGRRGHGR
ncbi:glycoside hydrolase family 32 protein [Streptomyces sp. 8K308]|uniref:glycoside hydrolase family 32 protein n=1 Tax=Streptomyces sp. 8K308 TaxID=2530388 RepID=UPI001048CCD3|nr:GH32 C-terminal domain-containing protein [Streptomyces sp. 8K308]TDC27972.1 glycoside hydrolase family 32 protein [Streptomyces sp. 8K308]